MRIRKVRKLIRNAKTAKTYNLDRFRYEFITHINRGAPRYLGLENHNNRKRYISRDVRPCTSRFEKPPPLSKPDIHQAYLIQKFLSIVPFLGHSRPREYLPWAIACSIVPAVAHCTRGSPCVNSNHGTHTFGSFSPPSPFTVPQRSRSFIPGNGSRVRVERRAGLTTHDTWVFCACGGLRSTVPLRSRGWCQGQDIVG